MTSRHLSVHVDAPAAAVRACAADPRNLPAWAAGLARGEVGRQGGPWVVGSPMGRVQVAFTGSDEPGVLDHVVTLPSGEQVLDRMWVAPDGEGCQVVPTVQRRDMTEQDFEHDCRAVAADLESLRAVVEVRR